MRRHSSLPAAIAILLVSGLSAVFAQAPASSKIWLGKHAEIENFLRTAKVVGEEEIKVGVTRPTRVLLEPGGPVKAFAFSKVHGRHLGFWDSYRADIAAYEVDKLLQLDMVPPVVERRHKGDLGRASMWVEDVRMWNIKEKPPVPPDQAAFDKQVIRMKMFDNFIGNTDRNQGNLLLDPQFNLILIDHTRAFTADNKLPIKMTRYDRELWERMLAITEDQLKTAIGKWVMSGQIKDVFKRRDVMAKEIATLGTLHP